MTSSEVSKRSITAYVIVEYGMFILCSMVCLFFSPLQSLCITLGYGFGVYWYAYCYQVCMYNIIRTGIGLYMQMVADDVGYHN